MIEEIRYNIPTDVIPFSKLMHLFTRRYIRVLYQQLSHLPIDRYYYVVVLIGRSEPVLSQRALGEIMDLDKAGIARMLNYLCRHGIIERRSDQHDKRQYRLLLTAEGKQWLPVIEDSIRQLNKQLAGVCESSDEWVNDLLAMGDLLASQPKVDLHKEVAGLLSKSKA